MAYKKYLNHENFGHMSFDFLEHSEPEKQINPSRSMDKFNDIANEIISAKIKRYELKEFDDESSALSQLSRLNSYSKILYMVVYDSGSNIYRIRALSPLLAADESFRTGKTVKL